MMTRPNRKLRTAILAASGLALVALTGCGQAGGSASEQSTAASSQPGGGIDQAASGDQTGVVSEQRSADRDDDGCGGEDGCGGRDEDEQTVERAQRRSEDE
jgi:hypothetical protein